MPDAPLAPAVAEVRLAVRTALASLASADEPAGVMAAGRAVGPAVAPRRVMVALSGGADSLALAAATAFEARAQGIEVVSVTVDHGLQPGSAEAAARAAASAERLGIRAHVETVEVGDGPAAGGPEAAARDVRYAALRAAALREAAPVLLGHTLDDQAETVLLGLARGSGAASLQGMAPLREDDDGVRWLRPLLAVRRATTRAACEAEGIAWWDDPHNQDPRFARVRVRNRVLPVLEDELGPGIAEALARTAEQLREDAEAFDEMIHETIEDIVEPAKAGIAVSVAALQANPAALRNRIIRLVVDSEFGVSLTRRQTLEVARLATDWSGQGPIDLPSCTARRQAGRIVFTARG